MKKTCYFCKQLKTEYDQVQEYYIYVCEKWRGTLDIMQDACGVFKPNDEWYKYTKICAHIEQLKEFLHCDNWD